MADRKEGKGAARVLVKKKPEKVDKNAAEKEKVEKKPLEKKPLEKKAVEKKPLEKSTENKPAVEKEGTVAEEQTGNGETVAGAAAGGKAEEFPVEPMELPPFEIILGERINPFFFKFQFKNVEYSSGRNKTFLCYLVDPQGSEGLRGYLEDEHVGSHAEEAFFQQILPQYEPAVRYLVTWYMTSSPCAACAAKLVEILQARRTLQLTIFCARLFMWEEPEIQAALKALVAAGCRLRMMKPTDFTYTWETFVENEEQTFAPWEDCQENYEYYQEKLADILQ